MNFTDTFRAAMNWRVWGRLALDDLWSRYRRTMLGPLWVTLAQAIWITGIYISREAFGGGADPKYLMHLTIGLVVFTTISLALGDGPTVLTRSAGILLSMPVPPVTFVLRGIASTFLNFVHAIPIVIIVAILLQWSPTTGALLAILGIVNLVALISGLYLLLAAIGIRFRDLVPAGSAVGALLFILTPVIWMPTDEMIQKPLIFLNPVYHMIEAIRAPLIGDISSSGSFVIAPIIGAVVFVIGLIVFVWREKDIAYWL